MYGHVSIHAWDMWGALHELVTAKKVLGTNCDVTIYLSTCETL